MIALESWLDGLPWSTSRIERADIGCSWVQLVEVESQLEHEDEEEEEEEGRVKHVLKVDRWVPTSNIK